MKKMILKTTSARVTKFEEYSLREESMKWNSNSRKAVVRITHSSYGATDKMSREGNYLLQPLKGFISGYDFVGVVEHLPRDCKSYELEIGSRVTGILPRMGGHTSLAAIPLSLLVPVPKKMSSEDTAPLPLDLYTAYQAVCKISEKSTAILVQGASGAVGSLAVQLAKQKGRIVYGTGSKMNRDYIESLGAKFIDYEKVIWSNIQVDGIIDHTGATHIRKAVQKNGKVIRIAFGETKRATFTGLVNTLFRRFASPTEHIISVPLSVMFFRKKYRRQFQSLLNKVADGSIVPPKPKLLPFHRFEEVDTKINQLAQREKLVLTMKD